MIKPLLTMGKLLIINNYYTMITVAIINYYTIINHYFPWIF